MKSKKITNSARGEECRLRIYPYCNGNPETVVFCHAPSSEKGMSRKSPDFWGAYGCSCCHSIIDGQMPSELTSEEILEVWMRAIFETQMALIEKGLITIEGKKL